jgi:hypothetical protein
MPEKPHNHNQLEVRRSDRLLDTAMRRGWPIEMAPDGETAVIHFRQPRANFTPEEWAECEAFKDRCTRRIDAIGRVQLDQVAAKLEAHEIDLGEYLRKSREIADWQWAAVKAECGCRPGTQGWPVFPDWKDEVRDVFGTPGTWRDMGKAGNEVGIVMAGVAGAGIALMGIPGSPVPAAVAARWAPPLFAIAAVGDCTCTWGTSFRRTPRIRISDKCQ